MTVFERQDELRLWRPPRLRTLGGEDGQRANYVELFFERADLLEPSRLHFPLGTQAITIRLGRGVECGSWQDGEFDRELERRDALERTNPHSMYAAAVLPFVEYEITKTASWRLTGCLPREDGGAQADSRIAP